MCSCYTEELKAAVIDQMRTDLEQGDVTAIDELLEWVDLVHLAGYLPEHTARELRERWNLDTPSDYVYEA